MSDHLYALLVGIDDYPPTVGALAGCVNDVEHLHEHLRTSGDPHALAVETLTNAQATRAAVVDAFRRHLGQAREGDVVLFHYSGHGARWSSAPAFKPWYPEGRDESLVCIDSRARGGHDLADKELAVLVHEVAARGAHVVVLLDCCHSGSGTRGADTLRGLRARVTREVLDPRPLDSYLDGWYAERAARGETLSIPTGRHILLAACERRQLAQETPDGHGVFTATLLDVLRTSPGAISYADLFVRCRAAVRGRADDQTPQFETYAHFNAWSGFLGRAGGAAARRYSVAFEGDAWKVDAGALHGLPADPDKVSELLLYHEVDPTQPVGSGTTTEVGPQKSKLALGFASAEDERYSAEITSLPVPPLPIAVQAERAGQQEVADALATDGSIGVVPTETPEAARYELVAAAGRWQFADRATGTLIRQAKGAAALLPALKQVASWERKLALANPASALEAAARVEFVCTEVLGDGSEHVYPGREVTLECPKEGAGWAWLHGRLKARHHAAQTLHLLLVYYSPEYGVCALFNEPVPPGDAWVTLYGDGDDHGFHLGDDAHEEIDRFKLIASTEKVDDYLLQQDDLELGATVRGGGDARERGIGRTKPLTEQWLTRDLSVHVVGRLDALGPAGWTSPNGRVRIKGHPQLAAAISLGAAPASSRSAEGGCASTLRSRAPGSNWSTSPGRAAAAPTACSS